MNGHVVYGQALFDSGRYEESQVTFTAALGLDPENLIALRHLGDIARIGNDAPVAMDWYKRVLDADPRNQEILAFIEELKLAPPQAAAAAPAPPEPAVNMVEIDVPKRPSMGATPIVPILSVSEPPRRPSLMDISIDLGAPADSADANATSVTGAIPTVPSDPAPRTSRATPRKTTPSTPAGGDLEFGDIDFGEPAASAQMRESMSAPPPADEPRSMNVDGPMGLETTDPLPPAEATQMDSSLGWEMPGDINLDAPPPGAASAPGESAPVGDTPQVFVTETMAELYLQQGFRDEALQVYRQLAALSPDDKSLQERVRNLEQGGRGSMSLDAVPGELPDFAPGTDSLVPMSEEKPTAAEPAELSIDDLAPAPSAAPRPARPTPAGMVSARTFFAGLAARRALRTDGTAPVNGVPAPTPPAQRTVSPVGGSIDGLFGGGGGGTGSSDDAIGLALATAVGQGEAGAAIRGKPTTPAQSELSLDSVFRGDSSMRSSGPVNRQSQVIKFDQFFAAGEGADGGAAPSAAPANPAAPASGSGEGAGGSAGGSAPADDAHFQSWLKGLKDK